MQVSQSGDNLSRKEKNTLELEKRLAKGQIKAFDQVAVFTKDPPPEKSAGL